MPIYPKRVKPIEQGRGGPGGGQQNNRAPVALLTIPSNGVQNIAITADPTASYDPENQLKNWSIFWGDGLRSNGTGQPPLIQHTYALPGVYDVTLTVRDKKNVSSTVTRQIDIAATPIPPTPVDCVLSEWTVTPGEWGACSPEGFQSRVLSWVRTVVTAPSDGGAPCGPLTQETIETRACTPETPPPTPVDCVTSAFSLTSFGPWGNCQPDGTQTRNEVWSRTVITPPSGGGAACGVLVENRIGTQSCTYIPPDPTPPPVDTTRPRLLMRSSDLATIGASVSTGGAWASSFQTAVTDIENNYWNLNLTSDANSAVYGISMAGFVYRLRQAGVVSGVTFTKTNAEYLAKGCQWLLQLSTNVLTIQPARQVAHVAWYLWIGYDWLHDGLTTAQMTQLFVDHCTTGVGNDSPFDHYAEIVAFKAASPGTVNGFNPRVWSAETTSRGFSRAITAALALQGDVLTGGGTTANAWAVEMISWYEAAFDSAADGIINRETQRGGTDGSAIQGFGTYGQSYDHNWLVTMAWAWRTANGLSKSAYYGDSNRGYFRGMVPYYYYMLRQFPHGSAKLYLKDLYSNADTNAGELETQMQMGAMRTELQGVDNNAAALAAYWIANKGADSEKRWVFSRFLGPSIAAASPTDVGTALDKAFQPGQWQSRSGWASNNDTIVNVWGYQFSGFNSAVGNFSVDYMGPSIITPGYGGHDFDTSWHGGGVNTLGCPELDRSTLQTGDDHLDDYGFHRVYNPYVPNMLAGTIVDWFARTELFHARSGSEDYVYLWIDRTRSFNGATVSDGLANSLKVPANSVYRQFMVWQPAVAGTDSLIVLVFDQMTVLSHSPIYQKRVHTYYAGTPSVAGAGGSSAGPSRGPSGTTGKTTYTGGTPVISATMTQDSCNNKVYHTPFCTTSALDVVLVQMRRFDSSIGWQFEDTYGRLTAGSTFTANGEFQKYIGIYRTEIIPTTANLTDRFVQAYEIGTSGASQSTTESWSGTNVDAVRVGTKVGAMGSTQNGTTAGTIVCKTAGTYKLLIGNLTGTRTLTKGANITSVTQIPGGGTGPTYTVDAKGCLYATVVVGGSGTGADNTLTIS